MTTPDITNLAVFAPLEEFIRTQDYSDADLFDLIGRFAGTSPHVAQAMAYHSRDIIGEHGDTTMTYTDIIVHVYWRTFYSPEHAGKYGTDSMVHHHEQLQLLTSFMRNPEGTPITPDMFRNAPVTSH